jgi:sterol desaturase/sphingolipid hydroxylase (fatty acid hydroxylase superfamily)
MRCLKLEQSRAMYYADFVFYAVAILALAAFLLLAGPAAHHLAMLGFVLAGILVWTAMEYAMHRFLLHKVEPFRTWHDEHHQRPTALICTPTIVSATLLATLGFLPALWLGNVWYASALTLGIVSGYFTYGATHHATHHWRANSNWLKQRKRWHARHHHRAAQCCYGVSIHFWDHLFGTGAERGRTGDPASNSTLGPIRE